MQVNISRKGWTLARCVCRNCRWALCTRPSRVSRRTTRTRRACWLLLDAFCPSTCREGDSAPPRRCCLRRTRRASSSASCDTSPLSARRCRSLHIRTFTHMWQHARIFELFLLYTWFISLISSHQPPYSAMTAIPTMHKCTNAQMHKCTNAYE